jgi:hypothetical protein
MVRHEQPQHVQAQWQQLGNGSRMQRTCCRLCSRPVPCSRRCLLQAPLWAVSAGSAGRQRHGSRRHWQPLADGGRTVTATGPSATVPAGGRPGWNWASGAAGSCSGGQRRYCRVRAVTCAERGGAGCVSRVEPWGCSAHARQLAAGPAASCPAVPASVQLEAAELAGFDASAQHAGLGHPPPAPSESPS